MKTFDPTAFNFARLADFTFPGGVAVYEYRNHAAVDGNPDFLRINTYLTHDGDFVTVWRGLLEPLFAESRLGFVDVPEGFELGEAYTENLLRGYIDSPEAAPHFLNALRLDAVPLLRGRAARGQRNLKGRARTTLKPVRIELTYI